MENEGTSDDVVSSVLNHFNGITNPSEKALKIKDEANQFFNDQVYTVAIKLYTKAIELDKDVAVFYGNRSMAYLRKELYGSALEDAEKALQIDPNYTKGYYRRATANMALGKFKLALKDYDTVRKARPKDQDALKKYEECSKMVKKLAFAKAISTDREKKSFGDSIKLETMEVESTYDGPRLDTEISAAFMKSLIETFKAQKKLHKKYAYKILLGIRRYLGGLPNVVEISVPAGQKFTICGDIHGQFYDLCNIFDLNGLPSETNPYLFNGDFVDRGSFSVETIFTLFGYKLLYPNHFFMSRGNHESDVMNKMYGFEGEVKSKYTSQMADFFTEIFNYLPLCHVINDKIFVCHGGLFKEDNVSLKDINAVDRVRQPPEEGIMCDLLWSDPHELLGRTSSKRGVGCQFGPDVTEAFCKNNAISYVIRSHEVKPEGYEVHHSGKCITVFSAPNYCDTMGNKGAFITIKGDNLKPHFTSFSAVEHPPVKPMAFASSLFGF